MLTRFTPEDKENIYAIDIIRDKENISKRYYADSYIIVLEKEFQMLMLCDAKNKSFAFFNMKYLMQFDAHEISRDLANRLRLK